VAGDSLITFYLQVGARFGTYWTTFFPERAEQQQLERTLPGRNEAALAPPIGSFAIPELVRGVHGSVLNRLTGPSVAS